jgi:hypothetical protein
VDLSGATTNAQRAELLPDADAATPTTTTASGGGGDGTGIGGDKDHGELIHGHAGHSSQDDLDTRLAAGRGEASPTVEPPLPPPDPAQQEPAGGPHTGLDPARAHGGDRLINRTLVYGLLTVLLVLVYAGGVFVLGPLLNPAGGESAPAVAAFTLAVAALFQPLRRQVQTAVDRRFNRRRYDAAKTVEAFSGRLRDHIDLAALSAELLSVVDQTMQPTRASGWLRPAVNQLGPLTAAAARAAPATGLKADQPGPGRGRPTAGREGGS